MTNNGKHSFILWYRINELQSQGRLLLALPANIMLKWKWMLVINIFCLLKCTLKGLHYKGILLTLPANIRPGLKWLTVTNTLANYNTNERLNSKSMLLALPANIGLRVTNNGKHCFILWCRTSWVCFEPFPTKKYTGIKLIEYDKHCLIASQNYLRPQKDL